MLKKSLFQTPNNPLEGGAKQPATLKCADCGRMIPKKELAENLYVCPRCGYHFRISARRRLSVLIDDNSFMELDRWLVSKNPLAFPDYDEKLAKARDDSNEREAVITGTAAIEGRLFAVFVMEKAFMMGSMGSVVGEKIARLFEYAAEKRLPVIGFTLSGGARMQEGLLSLMQMTKVSGAVKLHSEAGLLYITVLTDPTTGGVTASFAMQGDIILAEPKALVAFAGPRVIEQTIKKKLPDGFQRAEFLLEKGFVDAIVDRRKQRETLKFLIELHERSNPDA